MRPVGDPSNALSVMGSLFAANFEPDAIGYVLVGQGDGLIDKVHEMEESRHRRRRQFPPTACKRPQVRYIVYVKIISIEHSMF